MGTLPNSDKEQQTRLYEKPAASSAIFVKDYRILLTWLLFLPPISVYRNISAIFFTNLRSILSDWMLSYFYETEEYYIDIKIYICYTATRSVRNKIKDKKSVVFISV